MKSQKKTKKKTRDIDDGAGADVAKAADVDLVGRNGHSLPISPYGQLYSSWHADLAAEQDGKTHFSHALPPPTSACGGAINE